MINMSIATYMASRLKTAVIVTTVYYYYFSKSSGKNRAMRARWEMGREKWEPVGTRMG